MSNQWRKERDELGTVHYLDIPGNDGCMMKVEKSVGGDYFATAYKEGDAAGGDVEYFPTLAKAKKWAEDVADSGEWKDYVMFPEA